MSLWGRILAAGYDLTMAGAEQAVLHDHRRARKLEAKAAGHRLPVRAVRAPAEDLPFEPNSFDFVVSTLASL